MSYEFENARVADLIIKKSAKKVLIQLPDGLKPFGLKLADTLRAKTGAIIYISADPCYGSCDLPIHESKNIDVNLIIHYGHTPFLAKTDTDVIYINVESKIPLETLIYKASTVLRPYKKIGLITNIQHVNKLEEVKHILESSGKIVFIGSAGGLAKYDGQILGCDYTTADRIKGLVDIFLYVGSGRFHPLGVILATGKPVIMADPFLDIFEDLSEMGRKILRMRRTAVAKFLEADYIGIIVGLKLGQNNYELAENIQRKIESKGKRTVLLCVREINPEALDNFMDINVFVNTSCPRVGVDDFQNFSRPIVSVKEIEGLLARENDQEKGT